MLNLKERGIELRAQGFTPTRMLRRLGKEFPAAEKLDLHIAAGLGPTGRNPLWAEIGNPLRPVIARLDPRDK